MYIYIYIHGLPWFVRLEYLKIPWLINMFPKLKYLNCHESGINLQCSDPSICGYTWESQRYSSHRSQPRGKSLSLGTSSVTAHYWLKDAGVSRIWRNRLGRNRRVGSFGQLKLVKEQSELRWTSICWRCRFLIFPCVSPPFFGPRRKRLAGEKLAPIIQVARSPSNFQSSPNFTKVILKGWDFEFDPCLMWTSENVLYRCFLGKRMIPMMNHCMQLAWFQQAQIPFFRSFANETDSL